MLCKNAYIITSGLVGSPLNDSWQKAPPLLSWTGRGSYSGNCEPGKKKRVFLIAYKCSHCTGFSLTDLLHKAVCWAGYLVSDSSSIVIDGEDWQWVLGLGIVGAVPMVVVALLEEGMVSGLMKEHRGRVSKNTYRFTFSYFYASSHNIRCRTK